MARTHPITAAALALLAGVVPHLPAESLIFSEPSLDRWMYANSSSPGRRPVASTFSALPSSIDDENRLAQFVIAFDTELAGMRTIDWGRVEITAATVSASCVDDGAFRYDPSYDGFATYLPTGEDSDLGRPLELHGTGFRNDYNAASFKENSPHGSASPYGRNAYPLAFDASGGWVDVSHNVSDGFESAAWAIGKADLVAGAPVPYDTRFEFELDLSKQSILRYLRETLDAGRVFFTLSSLHPATQQAGEFVNYYTRESAEHAIFGDLAASLTIEISERQAPDLPDIEITSLVYDDASGTLTIEWEQHSGLIYTIYQSSDLSGWIPVREETATSDGTGRFTSIPGATELYYKVGHELVNP